MRKENEYWFSEGQTNDIEPYHTKIRFKVRKKIYSGRSKYQKIDFYETYDHGLLLTLDDVIMFTERDEFIYHEMIVHVPLFMHELPKRVLIIGGGDLGALREVLKHELVERVDLCEIDKEVVERCLEYVSYGKEVIKDKRVRFYFEDGFNFVGRKEKYYDVVIVDSSDPVSFAKKLYAHDFFKIVKRSLQGEGLMTIQAGSPFYNTKFIKGVNELLKDVFAKSMLYTASCHSYPGGYWGFLLGKKGADNARGNAKSFPNRYKGLKGSLRYYNEGVHEGSFLLPEYVKAALKLE